MTLFDRLFQETKKQEETYETPLFICGMFCNTADKCLDVETVGINGKGGLLWDNDDLTEFLQDTGINPETLEQALKEG